MSLKYKVVKNMNTKSAQYGKFYARAVFLDNIVSTKQLAKEIQANCTVTRADVLAVLSSLAEVMSYKLKDGFKVRLDGVGLFWPSFKSSPEDKAEDVSEANISYPRVLFREAVDTKSDGGTGAKNLIAGLTFKKLDENFAEFTEGEGGE